MRIEERSIGNVSVLELSGTFVASDGDEALRQAVERLLSRGRNRIVLDMREVVRLDCGGVGVLAELWTHVRRSGGAMALLEPTRRVRRMLELCGLVGVIAICGSDCDADAVCAGTSRCL